MATQNSINRALSNITIDPGASGDSFVQFDINTTGEFRIGVDDDASDTFKISQGSALGTNDTFVMSPSGERTMPLQPTFGAYNTAIDTNVTGDGTLYTGRFNAEIWDIGSDFDTSTFTYTAPVTGKYYFGFNSYLFQVAAGHDRGTVSLVSSSNSIVICDDNSGVMRTSATTEAVGNSVIFDLTAADTVHTTVQVSGSTKVVDFFGGSAGGSRSYFNCYLMG